MGKRKTGRKLAMQMLFQLHFEDVKNNKGTITPLKEEGVLNDSQEFGKSLASETWKNIIAVDKLIKRYAIDWDIERMSLVDKSLLRLAFYELLYTDTDEKIIVNEAIELAKKFSTVEAPGFINGILGSYLKDHV